MNVSIDISEQQLIDCAYDGSSAMGCNGASPSVYGQVCLSLSFPHEFCFCDEGSWNSNPINIWSINLKT